MKIVVLVKEVPDTYGERTLNAETGLVHRLGENALDEISERAVEAALTHAEAHAPQESEVVVLSMGPDGIQQNLRKCLAMGAHSAVHVCDDLLVGADHQLTAEVLAAVLERIGYDLVITGNQTTDGAGGVIPSMIAEHLGVPAVTHLSSLSSTNGEVTGERSVDGSVMSVAAHTPLVVSITEQLPEARFPNFKGIMAAKKKPFETFSLKDLGIDATDFSIPRTVMLSVAQRPARATGIKITDTGDAGIQLAAFLTTNKLISTGGR